MYKYVSYNNGNHIFTKAITLFFLHFVRLFKNHRVLVIFKMYNYIHYVERNNTDFSKNQLELTAVI